MTAPGFWEVGASGRRSRRQFVLSGLEEKYKNATNDVWEIADFHSLEIALATIGNFQWVNLHPAWDVKELSLLTATK